MPATQLKTALVGACALVAMHHVHGFPFGDESEYQTLRTEAKAELASWTYQRISRESIRFGDPVHEDMTIASIELARAEAVRAQCSSSSEQVAAFIAPVNKATVRSHMCCSASADSDMCEWLGARRYESFAQPAPLVTGVRWPDDPCHMTLSWRRTRSKVAWAFWMTDPRPRASSNLNYTSHHHELQFFHSMASASRGSTATKERAKTTQRRILSWAEFAFRVAEGSISHQATLGEAAKLLERENAKYFLEAFGKHSSTPIEVLFTGKTRADARQVRQTVMGALLHTVQDSFSSSHVERTGPELDAAGDPIVGRKGKVIRFLSYRNQDGHQHGMAERRPKDLNEAKPGAFHPVAIGAQLIACASSGGADTSRWAQARRIVEGLLELENPQLNPMASAGKYLKLETSTGGGN